MFAQFFVTTNENQRYKAGAVELHISPTINFGCRYKDDRPML